MAHHYASAECREAAQSVRDHCKANGLPDPWHKFVGQIGGAANRGVEWKLTFEDWWELWEPHYAERGSRKLQKVMCRHLDRGAYEKGNVRIDLACNNGHERRASNFMRWGGEARSKGEPVQYLADEFHGHNYGRDPLALMIAAEEADEYE